MLLSVASAIPIISVIYLSLSTEFLHLNSVKIISQILNKKRAFTSDKLDMKALKSLY
nr:MAG TPA: hypothetical protein [Caudoviricetes sp.]